MLDKAWENLLNIDVVGVIAFIIAGFVTYGAKFIAMNILNTPSDKLFKVTTILKIVGLIIGLFGLIRITKMM